MLHNRGPNIRRNVSVLAALIAAGATAGAQPQSSTQFHLQEASIADIQRAIMAEKITSTSLVELYLKRIKTYNNTCVSEPIGILGTITTIPHARQVNALSTLNLRPPARKTWGFDERKARSMTDMDDNNPNMPDALEVAAAQDRQFNQTERLVGPLHGVVMAIKDQYGMRTTAPQRMPRSSSGCGMPERSFWQRQTSPNTQRTARVVPLEEHSVIRTTRSANPACRVRARRHQ